MCTGCLVFINMNLNLSADWDVNTRTSLYMGIRCESSSVQCGFQISVNYVMVLLSSQTVPNWILVSCTVDKNWRKKLSVYVKLIIRNDNLHVALCVCVCVYFNHISSMHQGGLQWCNWLHHRFRVIFASYRLRQKPRHDSKRAKPPPWSRRATLVPLPKQKKKF